MTSIQAIEKSIFKKLGLNIAAGIGFSTAAIFTGFATFSTIESKMILPKKLTQKRNLHNLYKTQINEIDQKIIDGNTEQYNTDRFINPKKRTYHNQILFKKLKPHDKLITQMLLDPTWPAKRKKLEADKEELVRLKKQNLRAISNAELYLIPFSTTMKQSGVIALCVGIPIGILGGIISSFSKTTFSTTRSIRNGTLLGTAAGSNLSLAISRNI